MHEPRNHVVNILVFLGLIIVILALVFQPKSSVYVDNDSTRNTIRVSGSASITVFPDTAQFNVNIIALEDTASAAKDSNSDITYNVIKALVDAGIAKDDIESAAFNLYRKEQWNSKAAGLEFKGYEAYHSLKVTTADIDNVGKYIDEAVDAGANSISSILFTLSEDKQKDVSSQVLLKAADEASAKAQSLSSYLGVDLGGIVSISESDYSFQPYRALGLAEDSSAKSLSIQPQNLDVSGTVSLAYAIK